MKGKSDQLETTTVYGHVSFVCFLLFVDRLTVWLVIFFFFFKGACKLVYNALSSMYYMIIYLSLGNEVIVGCFTVVFVISNNLYLF